MWQKVANDEHAHYKDICNAQKTHDRPEIIFKAMKTQGFFTAKPKNDSESKTYRTTGNQLFAVDKWSKAMELYNRSLCAAKVGSKELISLAYANRSAVLFEMKKYGECLVDIDLAKREGYPQRLIPKLDKRRADCLRLIESGANNSKFEPKLSFEPNEKYPEMANVLEIQYSKEYGRHVVANCDIVVGQTLLMEKALMTSHRYDKFQRCDSCVKKAYNLIPCANCSQAMFCSDECSTSVYHQVECKMQTMPEASCNDNQLHIIRSLIRAILIFPTAEELQLFVEDAISSDQIEVPETLSDERSKYRAFLKIWHEPNAFNRNMFGQQVYFVLRTLLENSIVGPQFNTPKKRRFLMHLVAQHYCVINYSGNIVFDNSDDRVGWDFNEFRSVIASFVNHSCAPNVTLVSHEECNVLISIRPIKAGEQIFLSYFRNDKIKHSTADRQNYISAKCQFRCQCERCTNDSASPSERDAMKSDACFSYIGTNRNKVDFRLDGVMETEEAIALEGKCVEWLNTYGRMKWCPEMDQVTDCYRRLLASKFNHEIHF